MNLSRCYSCTCTYVTKSNENFYFIFYVEVRSVSIVENPLVVGASEEEVTKPQNMIQTQCLNISSFHNHTSSSNIREIVVF